MNEFSMIIRSAFVDEDYVERAVKLLDAGLTRKELIKTMSDRIRGEVVDWHEYNSEENCTSDKLIGAMLRRIDFEEIAAILYAEALEAKAELDAKREKATAEYEQMISDNPDEMAAALRIAEYNKGDVGKVAKGLRAHEYYRLLDARGIKHEFESGAGEAFRDAGLIDYRSTAKMVCERYQASDETVA